MAPKIAPNIAGIPKANTIFQSTYLAINPNLKTLFKKWTIAVSPIAIWIGKNKLKTGNKSVPSPKPEKNVSKEQTKHTMQTNKISMTISELLHGLAM